MEYLRVGRSVLLNPRGFCSLGLLGLLFLVDVTTLAYCKVFGVGHDCNFGFVQLLCKICINEKKGLLKPYAVSFVGSRGLWKSFKLFILYLCCIFGN